MSSVLRFDEWQDSDGNPVATGVGGFSAPGSIVAVKSALKTDAFSASVAAGGNVAVTGLSITHALSDASNKLLIMAYFGTAGNSLGRMQIGLLIADNGTPIGVGDAADSRTRIMSGGWGSATANVVNTSTPNGHLLYSPGDTSSHTYTVRAQNIVSSTETLYVNRTELDDNSVSRHRNASALTIMEVAG